MLNSIESNNPENRVELLMPKILPFRGYRYNPQIFANLTHVLAPPYDVISPEFRKNLIHRSEHNIVNLTLARKSNGVADKNHYSTAANLTSRWKRDGILTSAEKPSIWQVTESFQDSDGNDTKRYGYLALVKLEDYSTSGIRRHERTHKAAKEDRYRLLDATHMNFSPIFFVFNDDDRSCEVLMNRFPSETVQTGTLDFETDVNLQIEQTSDEEWIDSFSSMLANKPILIADGHHRYETARTYHSNQSGSELYSDYVLAYLVPSSAEGLKILPTHRGLFGLSSNQIEQLQQGFKRFFTTKQPSDSTSFLSVIIGDDKVTKYYLDDDVNSSFLDVEVFEEVILKKILGFSEDDIANKSQLAYFHNRRNCLKAVTDGTINAAFIMEALTVNKLMKSTEDGSVLPQKSTFFFPKIGAGMVMQSLEMI